MRILATEIVHCHADRVSCSRFCDKQHYLSGVSTLSSQRRAKSGSLTLMIGAAIVVWAGLFALVHGPFIFGYIAMHALTTGIFLWAIRRSDRSHGSRRPAEPALATKKAGRKRQATERVAHPQPVA
jgi:hypothetical protein